MKELKICFVMPFHINEGRGGGSEVQAWILAKELARRGYNVSYIAQSVQNKQGTIEIIDRVKIRWIRYFYRFRWANAIDYYKALKNENPDIIIQRHSSLVTGIIGFYTKKYDKKFVWMCNEDSCPEKWSYLKKQSHLIKDNKTNKIKSIYFLLEAFINDFIRNYGMKHAAHPFSQNKYQRDTLKREFGIDSFPMYSGHNKPDLLYSPEKRLQEGIVLWVANLGSRKRPELFIDLARKGEKYGFRFVMIGGSDDKSYLDCLFKNKSENLEWLGKKSFEQTLEWFDKAAFFVNTSHKINEGFPNTFIQAWLRGVFVFSLEVDPDDLIRNNKLGYVAGDIDNILQTLVSLSNKTQDFIEMSKRVIQYANKNHSIQRMTDNFLDIVMKDKDG